MTKRKSRPSKGFSDPNRYLSDSGDRCMYIETKTLVRSEHLIFTIYDMLDYDGNEREDDPITTKAVEKSLRQNLRFEGENWFDKMEYEIDGRTDSPRYTNAVETAKRLFPAWFRNYYNNTLKFITEGT